MKYTKLHTLLDENDHFHENLDFYHQVFLNILFAWQLSQRKVGFIAKVTFIRSTRMLE